MNWFDAASRLAEQVTHPDSRWRPIVAKTPRHVCVPAWWTPDGTDVWALRDGAADEAVWLEAAYADRSLVTQIGTLHADHAAGRDQVIGAPTSSSTLPSLLLQMYRHAILRAGMDVLDVGTGSGYGAALLAALLGDHHVMSVDVDEYLTKVAAERLDSIGLHPRIAAVDATGPLPGTYDRIVATVSVRPIPASWLAALRPGGRLVTTIADTALILTADRTEDGGATGRIEWDRAGFMATRHGPVGPPGLGELLDTALAERGEQITTGRYPVINVPESWELWSMLSVVAPGIVHRYREDPAGERTAWMLHADGSWARATGRASAPPVVHQSGPRRLWDLLDELRHGWLSDGSLPVYGARVRITPDGVIHLSRGKWKATIAE